MADTSPRGDFDAMARNMAIEGWHFHRATDGPFDRFQVMGERGCGTNVVRKSITKALRIARTEALGWKHGFPMMVGIPPTFLTICAVRAPKPWASSLYQRPWHAPAGVQQRSFADFLRSPWQAEIDNMNHFEQVHPQLAPLGQELQWDRHPVTGHRFANIFEMRNAKHSGLLSFVNRGASVAYVALDRFNADPQGFLDALAAAFDLAGTERGYRPITRRMGNLWSATVPRPDISATWAPEDIAFMNDQLEPRIESLFGFAPA